MHLWCNDSHLATPESRESFIPLIRFKKTEKHACLDAGSIWKEDYVPGTAAPLAEAADRFPGGRSEFAKWLKSRCTISQVDAVQQHHGVSHIWDKFRKCFIVIGTFLHYEPIFRAFLRRLMGLLYADGISWTEIRYV